MQTSILLGSLVLLIFFIIIYVINRVISKYSHKNKEINESINEKDIHFEKELDIIIVHSDEEI